MTEKVFKRGIEYQAFMEIVCYQCRDYEQDECPGIDACYQEIKTGGDKVAAWKGNNVNLEG